MVKNQKALKKARFGFRYFGFCLTGVLAGESRKEFISRKGWQAR
jgi:hypothetical protein